ncbi:flagellar biosynthesis protein FlhF [Bacillus marinisedimentorum]|uniref:flagellar biosynthesis protein FlhF n=1 Tax=Bacillus marinisedimentorum TaxID=1821260 RepID=UPI0007DFB8A1|nr:flagellar biosynthesis protein FlhF [Bacillus marinisedimentorum]
MKVKKYTAPSMPEVMKQVRSELGKDAVILNSKVVNKGGILGLFMKKNIEVVAAADPEPRLKKQESKPAVKKIKELQEYGTPAHEQAADPALVNEIKELKKSLAEMGRQPKGNADGPGLPRPIEKVLHFLKDRDVGSVHLDTLSPVLLEKWYLEGKPEEEGILLDWVKEHYSRELEDLSFGGLDYSKPFVNVVGPTSVGKTTTLAKLAAQAVMKDGKKAAFITTDTYRIAAIDQLKTYASILNVPLEVAYTMEDFKNAKNKFTNMDIVFIDTAGRNFRDGHYVKELSEIIDFKDEMNTYLVLALTAKQKDMEEIYKKFSHIAIDKFLFTKADETAGHGAALNMMLDYQIGGAYITTGQNVPDDIEEMSPQRLLERITGEME